MTCVCWSPDAKYVLTGGQDDLISIWSTADGALVARCQGHQSWVSGVAFDPWRCDDRNYRFGSVGEDGRLCLWDFNVGMLHRPRAVSQPMAHICWRCEVELVLVFAVANLDLRVQHSVRHRGSISSRYTALQRAETGNTGASRVRSNSSLEVDDEDGVFHPVEPRAVIPMLPPVLVSSFGRKSLVRVHG